METADDLSRSRDHAQRDRGRTAAAGDLLLGVLTGYRRPPTPRHRAHDDRMRKLDLSPENVRLHNCSQSKLDSFSHTKTTPAAEPSAAAAAEAEPASAKPSASAAKGVLLLRSGPRIGQRARIRTAWRF